MAVDLDYARYFFENADLDWAKGLKGLDYGLDLRAFWTNTFFDLRDVEFILCNPYRIESLKRYFTLDTPVGKKGRGSCNIRPPRSTHARLKPPCSETDMSSLTELIGPRAPSDRPSLSRLPAELLLIIADHLPVESVLSLLATSRRLALILTLTNRQWRVRTLEDFWYLEEMFHEMQENHRENIDWKSVYEQLDNGSWFFDSRDFETQQSWKNQKRIFNICNRLCESVSKMRKERQRAVGPMRGGYWRRASKLVSLIKARSRKDASSGELIGLLSSEAGSAMSKKLWRRLLPEISKVCRYATLFSPRDLGQFRENKLFSPVDINHSILQCTFFDNSGFLCGIGWRNPHERVFLGLEKLPRNGMISSYSREIPVPGLDWSNYSGTSERGLLGFEVAYNALPEDILSGRVVGEESKNYGIIGLRMHYIDDRGVCEVFQVGDWNSPGVKQFVEKRTKLNIIGFSVHIAEDGRIVSLGALEADLLEHVYRGLFTLSCPYGNHSYYRQSSEIHRGFRSESLEGRFWYPSIPTKPIDYYYSKECSGINGRQVQILDQVEEQAHLMDFFYLEDNEGRLTLQEIVFYGQNFDGKTFCSALRFLCKDKKAYKIVFKGMDLAKSRVLSRFKLQEDEELIDIHYLFEINKAAGWMRYSEGPVSRFIDIVFLTSKYRKSPFLTHGSPGQTLSAFRGNTFDFESRCIRGFTYDFRCNFIECFYKRIFRAQTPQAAHLPIAYINPFEDAHGIEYQNGHYREKYTYCGGLSTSRDPFYDGEMRYNIIIGGYEGNLPGQDECRLWQRTAMATSTLFPHQDVAKFDEEDFFGRPDYPLVAVSFLEAEQTLEKFDYGYDEEFWRQRGSMEVEYPPMLVKRGIRMLAFHFENGDTKVLANELYEREKASEAGIEYKVDKLLESANRVEFEPGYLHSITFKVRDDAAKSYIATLRIKTINKDEFLKSLEDHKAAGEGTLHNDSPRLVEPKTTQIYEHDPLAHNNPIGLAAAYSPIFPSLPNYHHSQPNTASSSLSSHPPYHTRILAESRVFDLDDDRNWNDYIGYQIGYDDWNPSASFAVDVEEFPNHRTTLHGDVKELEGVPDGVFEKRCVLWRGKKGYFWGGLRALYPGASEGRIVALAALYKNIGKGMGVGLVDSLAGYHEVDSEDEEDLDIEG